MDPQAIFDNYRRAVTQHYFDLAGRVGRPEFWYFVLANFVIAVIAAILQRVVFLPLLALYNLAMILPAAGMGARRLQDTGRDGRLVWVFIIAGFISQLIAAMAMMSFLALGFLSIFLFGPLVMLINLAFLAACVVLIYFWCQPGDPGSNIYGPPPPVFDASRRVSPAP
ncbi:MAG TPA: DUF805 domain-containing protein [Rhizomicrobium sp.]|jgi:uncharacterized membrane protein YhaH (DUF805 family)|nr:DUF805 domain-containing protein [Rhizomicrobium sp.]